MTQASGNTGESFPREFGEYTIRGELGRGAMGVVYDAMDRRLDRPVALKILRTDADPESQAFRRFQREAKSCASVRHDHIVEVYEAGEVGGRPFYAMTRVDGESLAELAKRRELPEPRVFFERLAGIADALHALHDAGVVHRDVKPSNILVEPAGRMVLADFGLARTATAGDLTQTGEALGTPIYMSPEQALGKRDEVDGLTDVYSLGATIYESLAGRPLFDAEDTRGMMRQVLHDPPRPLREVRPDVPKACESVVLKALEKEKRDRYPTAAALRDDLLAFSRGEPVVGRPVSKSRKAFRRFKWHGLAAASLILLFVGAVVLAGRANGTEPDPATRLASLQVLSTPPAEIVLDGEVVGVTPVTREVSPGEHELVMRQPGFRDHYQVIRLESGEKRTFERVLEAVDPEDPVALVQLANALSLPCAHVGEEGVGGLGTTRTGSMELDEIPAVEVGAAPPPELAKLAEHTLHMLIDDKLVEFRIGEENVSLRRRDAKHETGEELREVLGSVDKLVWHVAPASSGVASAEVLREQRVSPEVRRGVKKLKDRLKGQDPRVRHHLVAQYYLANDLPLHAFLEAQALARKGDPSPQTLMVMKEAMQQMGVTDCDNWKRVIADLRRVPPAQRRKLFRARREARQVVSEKQE